MLALLREMARRHRVSMGKEASRLIRLALQRTTPGKEPGIAGFEPFPGEGRIVTDDLVERLRDEEGV
ncbi:hypothetical protein [Methylomarinovum caldicuralii]|uniref:hypothetical protein n=1 Tax=Methylomarinovum caldicuralii TaxID=438856 RepID=UPI002953F3A0|nr:hypothetical protein [Methylomarinovum caldicuralii]